MKINNRRYIGCKARLIDFIYSTVENYSKPGYKVFADIFAGTGVVGNYFADKGYKVILNDTLYSNVVAYTAWLGKGEIDNEKISSVMKYVNSIDGASLEDNYFSNVYGGKYFSQNDAKKIGFIRDYIETSTRISCVFRLRIS